MLRTSARLFHSTGGRYAGAEKSALATLRKSTGYTFANCKKALELHNNDLKEAEKWLKEQAQAMGWAKATKLEGRATAQGLVGILIEKNIGAIVEVNCETDFVARNAEFQTFVERASQSCIQYMANVNGDSNLTKIGMGSDALKKIQHEDGKTLGDHLALLIGNVGENASLKRAICYKVPESVQLVGYVHSTLPPVSSGSFMRGKFGAIGAFKGNIENVEIQKKILQHIVGMNPKTIGEKEAEGEAAEKKDETETSAAAEKEPEESRLIFQEFLLDQDVQVGDVLETTGLTILDFQRFECGEVLQTTEEMN